MRYLLIVMLALAGGCAFIKPTTEIKFNPLTGTMSVLNTKDVDVVAKNLHVSKLPDGGGTFDVDEITISDKSSPVIEANVQQMLAFVEQQRAANEGIIGSLKAIGDMVGLLTNATEAILRGSNVNLDTQWGGGSATLGTAATQPGG